MEPPLELFFGLTSRDAQSALWGPHSDQLLTSQSQQFIGAITDELPADYTYWVTAIHGSASPGAGQNIEDQVVAIVDDTTLQEHCRLWSDLNALGAGVTASVTLTTPVLVLPGQVITYAVNFDADLNANTIRFAAHGLYIAKGNVVRF